MCANVFLRVQMSPVSAAETAFGRFLRPILRRPRHCLRRCERVDKLGPAQDAESRTGRSQTVSLRANKRSSGGSHGDSFFRLHAKSSMTFELNLRYFDGPDEEKNVAAVYTAFMKMALSFLPRSVTHKG